MLYKNRANPTPSAPTHLHVVYRSKCNAVDMCLELIMNMFLISNHKKTDNIKNLLLRKVKRRDLKG